MQSYFLLLTYICVRRKEFFLHEVDEEEEEGRDQDFGPLYRSQQRILERDRNRNSLASGSSRRGTNFNIEHDYDELARDSMNSEGYCGNISVQNLSNKNTFPGFIGGPSQLNTLNLKKSDDLDNDGVRGNSSNRDSRNSSSYRPSSRFDVDGSDLYEMKRRQGIRHSPGQTALRWVNNHETFHWASSSLVDDGLTLLDNRRRQNLPYTSESTGMEGTRGSTVHAPDGLMSNGIPAERKILMRDANALSPIRKGALFKPGPSSGNGNAVGSEPSTHEDNVSTRNTLGSVDEESRVSVSDLRSSQGPGRLRRSPSENKSMEELSINSEDHVRLPLFSGKRSDNPLVTMRESTSELSRSSNPLFIANVDRYSTARPGSIFSSNKSGHERVAGLRESPLAKRNASAANSVIAAKSGLLNRDNII